MAQGKSPAATEHRRMLRLLRAHKLSMTVSLILLGVATVLTLMQPLIVGRIIDRAGARSPIFTLAVLLVIMLLGQLLLESLAHFQLDRTGETIVLRLRAVFTNHVMRLPIGSVHQRR